MKCDESEMNISMYVDDALDAHTQESMFAHLATCADCRSFMRRMLDLRARLAALPAPEVPQSLDRRVLHMKPKRGRGSLGERARMLWSHRLSVPLPSVALAAIALITVTIISISLLQRPDVVSVPCLPAVDVYAEQPSNPAHGN